MRNDFIKFNIDVSAISPDNLNTISYQNLVSLNDKLNRMTSLNDLNDMKVKDIKSLNKFIDFGGIRIEDNIVITSDGYRILGPHIPRTIDEIEDVMA